MTIDNLRCFVVLAQELNFTRAADKTHITQTAMSRRIKNLEEELNATLFVRDHHHVSLTDAGQEFYMQAQSILTHYSAALVQLRSLHDAQRDSVRVGVGIYEQVLLLPIMKEFMKTYPVKKLNLLQFKYQKLLDELENDRLDIVLTSDQFFSTIHLNEYDTIPVHDYPWQLVINKENPLAQYNPIDMQLLKTENIITMNVGNINVIRNMFQPWFKLASIDYVNSLETKLTLVSANRGVGFVPSFTDVTRYPELVMRPLSPHFRRRKFYAVIKKVNTNVHARRFAEMLDSYYRPRLWVHEDW